MSLKLKSNAFQNEGMIPSQHTCDGANISIPLVWSDVPGGTESFAIIFDDPDAPAKTWVHWLLYNIPAEERELKENIPDRKKLPNGAMHGRNDFGNYGYGGPCPPGGTHGYYIKLYTLDTVLDLEPGITKEQLIDAMDGHILEKTELTGTYKRQ